MLSVKIVLVNWTRKKRTTHTNCDIEITICPNKIGTEGDGHGISIRLPPPNRELRPRSTPIHSSDNTMARYVLENWSRWFRIGRDGALRVIGVLRCDFVSPKHLCVSVSPLYLSTSAG